MSNNARVVSAPDGGFGEIGSAQYLQALAARVVPGVDMNPVLLKPEHDTASQVVLRGRTRPELGRMGWRERSGTLAQAARESFQALAAQYELIVVEGAGSPAEINLAAHDYVNLGTARWAAACGPTRALLVANIDQGGAFAHLYGTSALLPDDLRPLLAGHVLNMFRGDAGLLAPGPEQLQALTGVPVVAVIPRVPDHGLPEEDGWFHQHQARENGGDAGRRVGSLRRIVVVAYPRISNLDEFTPLTRVPGHQLSWARDPADLAGADWVILPGSKQVSTDLQWLRDRGLDAAVRAHVAAGGPVVGVCGGLQMLGQSLSDPQGFDGVAGRATGLGLLPLVTHYEADKRVRPGNFVFREVTGPWRALRGVAAPGYEILQGRTLLAAESADARVVMLDAEGQAIAWQRGTVLGVYAHGLFESPVVLQALFGVAVPSLESTFGTLADRVERHFEPGALDALFGG